MTSPVANIVNTVSTGGASTVNFINVVLPRDPTPYDYNYQVQKRWINSETEQEFYLLNFTTSNGVTLANWIQIGSGSMGLESLTGNSGGSVSPDSSNNINIKGDGTSINILGSPSSNTLTANVILPAQYDVLLSNTSSVEGAAPSTTAGVPLVSTGSSSQPAFGTATVPGGGTGDTSFTAYSVICGGTTSTGSLQSVTSVGTSGQFLTSQGAGMLPTWTTQSIPTGAFTTINVQVFPASGIYTATPNMKYVVVEVQGGGGGGGGAEATPGNAVATGPGGGGGAYCRKVFDSATIGASQTVTIGAGGTAGSFPTSGGTGGDSSFGSFLTAHGGVGGTSVGQGGTSGFNGGAGGSATGGDVNINGGSGAPSWGGGTGDAFATNIVFGGQGGSSILGGSVGGYSLTGGSATSINGNNGISYGGGGEGGVSFAGGTAALGGGGASGIVICTEFIS